MAELNNSAKFNYTHMNEDQKKIAIEMVKMLEGMEVGDANQILNFCIEAIKTKAVVKL